MKLPEFAVRRPALAIALVLGLVTFLLYLPVVRNDFVNFDDQGYITDNPHVNTGLSRANIVWAFTSGEQANWHPLTWISHMADCQFFGLNPGAHHLMDALLHVINTLLLFFLLKQMTGRIWPSAFVAALFGWHPLHVESVAWASERKDVLSTCFWLLTMMAYTKYVKQPRVSVYLLALFLFACALMSKPMAVTLPFVLLLMDFWPLNRLTTENSPMGETIGGRIRRGTFLVFEKAPFFALALADCCVTFLVQRNGGAVMSANALPFSYRLGNALWSYLRYVSSTLCPTDLSVIYPYKVHLPVDLVSVSIALLVIWTGLFFLWRKKFPYLLIGWLWFLGTLVPTIGLVQVGSQSMADRYMYIPGIGLFILIVWGVADVIRFHPQSRRIFVSVGVTALAVCLAATSWQISYWRNSISLFTHAIKATGDNSIAYYCLGLGYEKAGDKPDALTLYAKSVELEQNYWLAQLSLGRLLLEKGDDAEAMEHFSRAQQLAGKDEILESGLGRAFYNAGKTREAVAHLQTAMQLEPGNPQNHYFFGVALKKAADITNAIAEFDTALRLQPDYPEARYSLAETLLIAGQTNAALGQYETEVKLHPDNPEAHYNLGLAYLDNRQFAAAESEFNKNLQLTPDELKAHYQLAETFAAEKKYPDAAAQYRAALRLLPDFPDALNRLAWLLATCPDSQVRSGSEAVQLAGRACTLTGNTNQDFLTTLSAAYAEAGQFSNAVITIQKVQTPVAGNTMQAGKMLKLYQAGQPFHDSN